MSAFVGVRPRSAEDQIWEHLDRMRNAGPVADYYLAAHERQAWAIGTRRAAPSGPNTRELTATPCRRWIATRLIAVGRRLERRLPVQTVNDTKFMPIQRRMVS